MLQHWHVVSPSGDLELKAHPDDEEKCLLVTEDLTPVEVDAVGHFLQRCRQYKWVDHLVGVPREGRTELVIEAPLSKCGKHLAGEAMPKRGRLTAVRSKDGTILAVTDGDDPDEAGKLEEAAEKEEAADAVTTRRPTKCCPMPIEGPLVRSSRVLRKFCTPTQWRDWCEKGWLICYGHLSGHAYRLVHRHHPAAAFQSKVCWDLDDNQVLHAWDHSCPPAEEVLNFKLRLEHNEPSLRSSASGFPAGRGSGSIGFADPTDNGYAEGLWDAALLRTVGETARGAIAGAHIGEVIRGARRPEDVDFSALAQAGRDLEDLFRMITGGRPRVRFSTGGNSLVVSPSYSVVMA